MNKERAEALVTFNLYKYKLLQNGWRFSWHNKKVSLGTCSYNKKRIYLAKWYVELNDDRSCFSLSTLWKCRSWTW